ncbi:MAG TPA: tripartite tricarboxylate transporter substrate binding protein, partial [Burkholderiales bacterium]|nr:tripartite tricarboxylate transporter substrate binding protein [Burkholderiales bacterium]
VVPLAAGAGVDTVSRITAGALGAALGQQLIVDNRPGGRGIIGVEMVARAAPDGHTLLVYTESFTIMPFIERKIPFDPRRNFTPVSLLATQPLVLAVHPSVPARSVKEFIALARARPGAISYGTGGPGHQLAGEWLKKAAGFDMTHVPYKGGAPAVIDLVGGQLQAAILGQSPLLGFARSGKVRILAVTTRSRSNALPDVPTLSEAGVAGVDPYQWVHMLAPARTPKAIVSRLNAEIGKALTTPGSKERLQAAGYDAAPGTPQQLDTLIRESLDRWGKLIPELNIKPE